MFMNLLFRGMYDIFAIFNENEEAPASEVQSKLSEANDKAKRVWNDKEKSFLLRKTECGQIMRGILKSNKDCEDAVSTGVPQLVGERLSHIFTKHYGQANLMLIGRTTEEAYTVQDRYASEVVRLLWEETKDDRCKSRAVVRLQTVYGASSMPLLCTSSVSAMWQLCTSSFYKKQLFLVSPAPSIHP